jgi:hypothetical protein
MRPFALLLLVAGFLWLAWYIIGFTGFQHSRWMRHTQHLPPGETISRGQAVNEILGTGSDASRLGLLA